MPATDLAAALRSATTARGHRPAITVLGAGGEEGRRDEQSFASLQQWVAKGAHLLEVDLDLGPGRSLCVDAPPGWLAAAVCCAAWWIGASVTDQRAGAEATVAHETSSGAGAADWLLGDAVDGGLATDVGGEPWALAVQGFPDQPPIPRAAATATALVADGRSWTQADLLAAARALPPGRLGSRGGTLARWAVALAARPAATGDPTVLVASPDPAAEAAERIEHWA